MSSLFSLQGRTAVVIGGTGELCGAMAEGFAGAGAHVILVGRDPVKAEARLAKIKAAGGSGEFKVGEATNKADLIRLRDEILAQHGKVDILVNGAGVNSPTPFLEIDEAQLDRILTVNRSSTSAPNRPSYLSRVCSRTRRPRLRCTTSRRTLPANGRPKAFV
jgi:NAD(P)-dependent dehydrogenase (short-subunit alcohol dehydrogenase family)